ncbi:ArnT family glycosyltransferase [Planctomicrobium sp. SH661]|uniref:ArnT family glycosyltransferase n=1 Tax=Planctomicrobium sp. SH661 TaxID=3448124 RepID=UPI003F5AE5A5
MSVSAHDHRERRTLLIILVAALVLRLIAACGLQYLLDYRWHRTFLIEGDAEGYWMLAQRIAAGEDYSVYTPPRYVLRMPGFPALLAISIKLFGPSLFAARLFLAGVGTLACWQLYRLGKQVFSARVGLIAAALAAVSPVLIVFTETILSETAFAVTLLWSLLAGHQLHRQLSGDQRPSVGRILWLAVQTGIAIAAGVMMRPSWLLAAPTVAVLLILTVPNRVRAAWAGGLIIASMYLALLPWGIRNAQVTGHFTFTTFWAGPSLYDGLNPEATGDSDMRFFDRDNLMQSMSEYEVDQHYRKAARKYALEHPRHVLELAVAKGIRYWSPWPNAAQFSQWWARLIVGAFFVPVLLLAIWGSLCLFGCSREGRPAVVSSRESLDQSRKTAEIGGPETASGSRLSTPDLLHFQKEGGGLGAAIWSMAILAGPILYFAVIHLVFVSSLRYRLPAEYPLLVLSAYGFESLRHGVGSRKT